MKISYWKNEHWNEAEEIPFKPRIIKKQDEEGNEWDEEEEDERPFAEKFILPLPQSKQDDPLFIKMECTFYTIAHWSENGVKEEPIPKSTCCPDMTEEEAAIGYYKLLYELPKLAEQS